MNTTELRRAAYDYAQASADVAIAGVVDAVNNAPRASQDLLDALRDRDAALLRLNAAITAFEIVACR